MKKIKTLLKQIGRKMINWPIIGRFVQMGVAIIRFPALSRQMNLFQNHQLPQLLETISEINHKIYASTDNSNLIESIPITLRKITRDLIDTQAQLKQLSEITVNKENISKTTMELSKRIENIREEIISEIEKLKKRA